MSTLAPFQKAPATKVASEKEDQKETKPKKICCACPETKEIRDLCVAEKGPLMPLGPPKSSCFRGGGVCASHRGPQGMSATRRLRRLDCRPTVIALGLLFLFCNHAFGDIILGEVLHDGGRKRVTLRNAGADAAVLADYALRVHYNPPGMYVRVLDPVDQRRRLEPWGNFSICYESDACDVQWRGTNFNGNDVIELLRNGQAVDILGRLDGEGVADGGWKVAGVPAATRGHLLVRNADVQKGNLNWTDSAQNEWSVTPDANQNPPETECWEMRRRLRELDLDVCRQSVSRESVVVGTFNTEFLFDGVSDPSAQSVWPNPEAAQRHLERVADVISDTMPDLLALQEVENAAMLESLVTQIGRPEYNTAFAQGRDGYTGQDMGLLSLGIGVRSASRTDCRSGQVPGSSCGSGFDDTVGVSKNLITLFDSCLFGTKFALVGVHFYAFPTSPSRCVEREAQARVIQDVVAELLDAGFEVIVTGDTNDYSDVYPDAMSNAPTSRVLSMLRDPDNDGTDELLNVMAFLREDERYTAWWDVDDDGVFDGAEAEGSQIDHILLTRGLYSRIRRAWIDHRPEPGTVSDHWPLYVELDTATATEAYVTSCRTNIQL